MHAPERSESPWSAPEQLSATDFTADKSLLNILAALCMCLRVRNKIKKGQTVMIVEAMKTMNHVPSTKDGVVKEVCVEDGQPVEFGQTIIILE